MNEKSNKNQLERIIFILLICASFAACINAVYQSTKIINKNFPGFLIYNNFIVSQISLKEWAINSGFNINSYDKVLEVNGEKLSDARELYNVVENKPTGTVFKYVLERNNTDISVDIPSQKFTIADYFQTFIVQFVSGLIILLTGVFVYLSKPKLLTSKILLFYCISLSLWFIMDFDNHITYSLFYTFNFSYFFQSLTSAFVVILFLVFPMPRKFLKDRYYIFAIPIFITLSIFSLNIYFKDSAPIWQLIDTCVWLFLIFCTSLALGTSVYDYYKSKNQLVKERSQVALIGYLLGFFIPAVLALIFVLFGYQNMSLVALPVLFFPLTLGYAIVKHKLFDIEVIIQKTIVYGLSTAAIAALFIVSFFGFNILFTTENTLSNPTYLLLLSTIVVIAVNPLKNLVQKFVDSMFFRTIYDYASTITEFSDSLSSLLNIREISNLLTFTVQKSLFVENGYLFIINSESGIYKPVSSIPPGKVTSMDYEFQSNETLIEFLYKNKKEIFVEDVISESQYALKRIDLLKTFADLNASIIFPLFFKSDLLGIFVLGNKKSGQAYTTDDINFIRTMTTQAAIAIENSFSFGLVQDYADELEEKNIQLKDVQTQLIQAEKMSAIGHLASGLAHEIRNPLNIIEGARYYLSTIFSNGSENRIAHEYLEYIQNEVVRTNRLIDSLLDFSKYQQSNIENININNVIENVLILSRKQLSDSNIKLIKNLNADLPTLKGDSNQLWQVVINLLMNSIQAINSVHSGSEDGEIVIETGKYSKDDMENGQHLYLKFMDNGCGIKESDLSSIFDPFFTKKPDGTGLGLSVSYKIIEAHSGSFFVSSEVGIGTSFMVELPLINNFTGAVVGNEPKENINS